MATMILIRDDENEVRGLNAEHIRNFATHPSWVDGSGKCYPPSLEIFFSDGTCVTYQSYEAHRVLSILESLAVSPRPEVG